MKMMGVKKKEGGNAIEWAWKDEGSSKVCYDSFIERKYAND
jgi:hypothetical protein